MSEEPRAVSPRRNSSCLTGCLILAVSVLLAMFICGGLTGLGLWLRPWVADRIAQETVPDISEVMPTQAPTSVGQPAPQATPVAPAGGEVCVGPAILEDQVEGRNAVIKIDAGETWTWYEPGECFGEPFFFGDQGKLDDRFPGHVEEYRANVRDTSDPAVLELQVEGDHLVPYQSAFEPQGQAPTSVPQVSGAEQSAPNTVAWHQDTNHDTWEASPVGQLGSIFWIVAETWGPVDGDNRSFVVLVPPGAVMWIQRHFGGTGWWLASDIDPMVRAEQHADGLEARDGVRPMIVRLPEDSFPLLGCLQSQPVGEDNIRHCDSVGGLSAFTVKVGEPFPGYFPTQGQ